MADYDQITIQKQLFRVPLPYKAGHVLKENEAQALNQTFHENIRNNFAKKVVEGMEAGLDQPTLQQQLDDYVADYEFGQRTGGGGFRGDPVMTLAMGMARELVRKAIKAKGLSEEDWGATRISQTARALLDSQGDDGAIIQAAREQVEKERKAAQAAMEEVSEIIDQQAQAAQ